MEAVIQSLYAVDGVIVLGFYLPQLRALWKDSSGAQSTSIKTWTYWSISQCISITYMFFVAKNLFLLYFSVGHLIGCSSIALLAAYRRHEFQKKSAGVLGSLRNTTIVWKYTLQGETTLEMPEGAKVLSVREEGDTICLWALVDPNMAKESRKFLVLGAGQAAPLASLQYHGTAFLSSNQQAAHVFEMLREAPAKKHAVFPALAH